MPRTPKYPQSREDEDEDEDDIAREPPRVDELEPEDDRAQVKLYDEDTIDIDEEDIAEDIDLDDLAAMEGPDA